MKVVENAYNTVEEVVRAIYRSVKREGRSLNDFVIVTNEANYRKINNASPVKVDAVHLDDYESLWGMFQSLFSSDKGMALEDYGVDKTTAREYQNAIKYGKYVLLVDELNQAERDRQLNLEEANSRFQDTERMTAEFKRFGPGLDLDDPDENKTFGRTPQQ